MKRMAKINVEVIDNNGNVDVKRHKIKGNTGLILNTILGLFYEVCDKVKLNPKEVYESLSEEMEKQLAEVRKNEKNGRNKS